MSLDGRWSLAALSLFLLSSCAPDSAARAPLEPAASTARAAGAGSGTSVSGHANIMFEGELQTTSFHARILPDGRVQGTLQLNAGNGRLHGEVECLRVAGNQAVLGGQITQSDIGGTRPAVAFWLHVEDNGEGASAAPDQWSDLIYYLEGQQVPASICETALPFPLFPIEGGNIQVRP